MRRTQKNDDLKSACCDAPTIIHASSKAKCVLVEPKGLVDYAGQRKKTLGITVVRPMDCGE